MKHRLCQPPDVVACVDAPAHCVAALSLAPDEQVTFAAGEGLEYDVATKDWGLYATPSLGQRLARFGLRPALVSDGEAEYLMLVDTRCVDAFAADMAAARLRLICWLPEGLGAKA
jgi:hypothetical protein